MAWTAPRTWVVAEVVTAALMNTHVKDDLKFLHGDDGPITLQDALIIDNSLGTEYLSVPSLTTTQRDALTPVNGMVIYNSTLTVFQRYEAGAWVSFTNLAAMTIASIAQGDIFFRGASLIERLGAGTSGYFLKTQGAGANPIWSAGPMVYTEITTPPSFLTSTAGWEDWDLSATIPSGGIAVVILAAGGLTAGVRKNGSASTFTFPINNTTEEHSAIVVLDANRIIEVNSNAGGSYSTYYAIGYFS